MWVIVAREKAYASPKRVTHLALGAKAVGAVNPDILGNDLSLLRKLKVLLELFYRSVELNELLRRAAWLTLAVLEIIVDCACSTISSRAPRPLRRPQRLDVPLLRYVEGYQYATDSNVRQAQKRGVV